MMSIYKAIIAVLLLHCCLAASGQRSASPVSKTLTVADGLPQSFISGLVQDRTGFIWIGTRDGLARYDGKKFKIFRHIPGDPATLENNTINRLHLDAESRLWIEYETGNIDILNTKTERLFHLTKSPVFKVVFNLFKTGCMGEDAKGNMWLLGVHGGIFVCNLAKGTVRFYSEADLDVTGNKIIDIAGYKGNILLITDTALVVVNENAQRLQQVAYTFSTPHLYRADHNWKESAMILRQNGDVVFQDEARLLIYSPGRKSFQEVNMPGKESMLTFYMARGNDNDIYLTYGKNIYSLSAKNELHLLKPASEGQIYGYKSVMQDRSGVLWVGGNGSGIHMYDLRLSRLPGYAYKKDFQEDVCQEILKVPEAEIKNTFLYGMQPYRFRWMEDTNGRIWFSKATEDTALQPLLCYYKNGHIIQAAWRYGDTVRGNHISINAMAQSRSGKLWGMDFNLRLLYLDTLTHTVTVYPPVTTEVNLSHTYTVNSLLIDNEDEFWISTALNGLFKYNKKQGKITHYFNSDMPGSLPTDQLMNVVRDPSGNDIFWIGSLGGGLIRFNKATGKSTAFTTRDGLPNNTVYSVVADNYGMLWCSSNKGIFSFDPGKARMGRSFTSKDGLPCDEFNRYHFLKLPDGRIAFGGIDGYTVFDPVSIANDDYQPQVALTGIRINNSPADFGAARSPFKSAVNSLPEIRLDYNHNFLTFEFAALQYNITEKLQYRYMLDGFDEDWVSARNDNIATYTKIPPGHYLLRINATNTVGKWSRNIKTLAVVIEPPFWRTWWFIALCISLTAALLYLIVRYRIQTIRKEERQKAAFEREASELKAQALRAQMNPHFIFNCLNSIKALIQEENKFQAIAYLTTFSKLIRNMLNNVEQEISLYEELQTCRLYTQLEALRFSSKIVCEFEIEQDVDTRSVLVPPLILQPFIENAIWHGILPKDGGKVTVSVSRKKGVIECAIEDNGIGREMAMRNKSQTSSTYESKGMKLVKSRLHLFNSLHNRGGSIEVIDKKSEDDNPAGTLVIVKLKDDNL